MESDEVEVEHGDEEGQETEYKVIPVQLVETYDGVSLSSQSNSSNISSLSKGKYYKQTYRPAWEQMPDFKGWLRGVEGEPTRAYCTYCHKTLHAHRLSLLKHTCTIRHQKAAQLHSSRKNKHLPNTSNQVMENPEIQGMIVNQKHEDEEEVDASTVEFLEPADMEDMDSEHEMDNEDDEDCEQGQIEYQRIQTSYNQQQEKAPISTHVIDTTRGKPITGLQVSLYKLIDGRWTYINEGVTNSAGKFSQFLERCDFTQGRYKLHYDVDRYFESRKQETLYPFIEIVFDSTVFTESYHIPLLLSPFGYSTYRGS